LLRVITPVKLWVKALPKFNVPPKPFIVKAPALMFPVKVAVFAVLVIDILPVVTKPAILCAVVPVIVIFALPPFKVPAIRVTFPVMVWETAVPKFSVPPVPLIVKLVVLKFPLMVAVPPVLAMVTEPVVVNPDMFWFAVPVKVIPPALVVNVPFLMKSPPIVSNLLFVVGSKVAPEFIVSDIPSSRILFAFKFTVLDAIIIPPDEENVAGHSLLVLVNVAVLPYLNVADGP